MLLDYKSFSILIELSLHSLIQKIYMYLMNTQKTLSSH